MHFDISSSGTLTGRTQIPGDLKLTLSVLAFGMLSSEEVTITNVSPSPDVESFLNFLKSYGAVVDHTRDHIKLRGKACLDTVLINAAVPDSIFHCVVSSAAFTSHTVKIEDGSGSRSFVVRPLLDLLKTIGLTDENITEDGKDIIVSGAVFSPPDIVNVGSTWAFEAVIAAAFALRKPVIIAYPTQLVSQSIKLLTLLGCKITHSEEGNNRDIELSRRLARAGGGKSRDIRKFEWTEKHNYEIIKIPGDTTIASAVCGTTALLQGSDVTLEGVVWEQGRRGFFESLRRMKINIEWKHDKDNYSFDSADIRIRWNKSNGIYLSSDQALTMLSELLVLASVAASASGKTVICEDSETPGFGRDSFKVIARGLEMLGAHVGDFTEGIILHGVQELKGDSVDSGGESNVALALAVAGLAAWGTTTISGFGVNDYPLDEFLRIIKHLSFAKQ